MRVLIKSVLFLGLITSSLPALASFPFPNGECSLKTGVQTWVDASKPELKLKDSSRIENPQDSPYVGFKKIKENHKNSCGEGIKCKAEADLRIGRPQFIHGYDYGDRKKEFKNNGTLSGPVDYKEVEIKESSVVIFTGGEYWIKELKISEKATLKIEGKTVINVEELTVEGKIINDGLISDLIVIAHGEDDEDDGEIKIKTKVVNEIRGYFFAEKEIKLEEKAYIRGAIASREVEMVKSSKVVTDLSDCEPPLPKDLCDFFPQPAQSWQGAPSSQLTITNSKDVDSAYPFYIKGWSEDYVADFLVDNPDLSGGAAKKLLKLGFDEVGHEYQVTRPIVCDVGGCSIGGRKIETPPTPSVFMPQSASLELDGLNYKENCKLPYCRYQQESDNTVTVTILDDLSSLRVAAYSGVDNFAGFNVKLQPKSNGRLKIGTYASDGERIKTTFASDGIYAVETISFNGGTLKTGSSVVLYVKNSFTQSNAMSFDDIGGKHDLVFYGPEASFTFNTAQSEFKGYILGRTVTFNNPILVTGAVTAGHLTMMRDATIIMGGACAAPPIADNTITVSPQNSVALSCEVERVKFQVRDSDGNKTGNYFGDIVVSTSSDLLKELVVDKGTELGSAYQANSNGELWFDVKNQGVGDAQINATIVSSATPNSATSKIKFVANKFAISPSPLNVIAGKEQAFTIQPMECASVGNTLTPVVDTSYIGNKTLTMSDFSYDVPAKPTVKAELKLKDSSNKWVTVKDGSTIDVDFKNNGGATANSLALYPEAGRVSYQLSQKQCVEEDGKEKCKTYYGVQQVDARPWTFAICPTTSKTMNGTSSDGDPFVAAGEAFELDIKPIVYRSSGTMQAEYDLCSVPTTKNFYNSDSWPAKISLTHKVASPTSANDGMFSGVLEKFNTEVSSNMMIRFDGLSITEVGSFNIYASSQDNTYKEIQDGIEPGVRDIGRFYPKYFKNITNTWDYSKSQSFAYMNQAFDALEFKVEALNANKEVIKNYYNSGYNNLLRAKFALFENSSNVLRLKSPTIAAGDWIGKVEDGKSVGVFNYSNTPLDCDTGFCWKKGKDADYLDGPFNLEPTSSKTYISIDNSGSIDPIAFASSEDQKLKIQPDIRFGRMILEDVGGTQGKPISIPLKVEYWDGESFVKNKDDNSTSFDGKHYHTQPIWQAEALANNVRLTNTGTVSVGESRALDAAQVKAIRERSRIWLELSSDKNSLPWLQYDWSNNVGEDEEDPSAVVTFGSYRGNDRVIFRGESRLTGH